MGLDLSLRPVDLLNVAPGSAPPGSFRAAQDVSGDAWSGLYGGRWAAEGYQGPGAPPPWAGGRDRPLGFAAPLLSACRRRSRAVIPREDALTRADLLSKMTVRRLPGGGAACKKQTV